jgi:hypothetical protein
MGKSEGYRRFAQECLKMAGTTQDPLTRATFLQMAQVWFRLAQENASDTRPDNEAPTDPDKEAPTDEKGRG